MCHFNTNVCGINKKTIHTEIEALIKIKLYSQFVADNHRKI